MVIFWGFVTYRTSEPSYMKWISAMKHLVIVCAFASQFIAIEVRSQPDEAFSHLQVQRLNDSQVDVYFNKPTKIDLPIVLFCQGSGYDSNTAGFLGIIRQFEDKAVGLAIEKEGVELGDTGDSLTNEYKVNNLVSNRLYDYLRVLQYMKTAAPWWNGDLFVVGGSEGGLLAGMLACYYPNVKGVAIFSFGAGLNFGEAWPIAVRLQKEFDGAGKADIDTEVASALDSLQLTRITPTHQRSYSGEDNTYAWWNSILDLRLNNCLIDLDIPIYLAQGSDDMMSPAISAQTTIKAFLDRGKTNLFYKEYAGYDHSFLDKAGNSHLVEVVTESIRWILRDE